MNIQKDISLKSYNTFGIEVKASLFVSINNVNHLKSVLSESHKDILILGGGSNILFSKEYLDRLVIHMNNKGIELIEETQNHAIIRVQAGEIWDDFVRWSVKHQLGGVENLALIPGKVGAAPVQNIGAYGQELKDVMLSCQVLNKDTLQTETYENKDCLFGYRDSVFKTKKSKNLIIISVNFILKKPPHILHVNYGNISEKLKKNKIDNPTIKDIMNTVIEERTFKLPNPKKIGNAGSFFKNPIVNYKIFKNLTSKHPFLPTYKIDENTYKIPAGWLIEQMKFKNKHYNNVSVYNKQALVIVNHGDATGTDILKFACSIQKAVYDSFKVKIEFEVTVI